MIREQVSTVEMIVIRKQEYSFGWRHCCSTCEIRIHIKSGFSFIQKEGVYGCIREFKVFGYLYTELKNCSGCCCSCDQVIGDDMDSSSVGCDEIVRANPREDHHIAGGMASLRNRLLLTHQRFSFPLSVWRIVCVDIT